MDWFIVVIVVVCGIYGCYLVIGKYTKFQGINKLFVASFLATIIFVAFAVVYDAVSPKPTLTKEEIAQNAKAQPLPLHSLDIHIRALDLVKAYNNPDRENKNYEGLTVFITGKISGLFIPPLSLQLRAAKKGLSAEAFIYFSDKPVSDVKETLMGDGVSCYLDESTVAKASQMHIGQSVTLRCKCTGDLIFQECKLVNKIPSTTKKAPQ